MEYKCPKCGETENLHYNLDYSKQHRPVLNAVCNECGNLIGVRFDPERPIGEIIKEEEMWFMAEQNQKMGLYDPPYVSDDFQIGPDGAYEHTETEMTWDDVFNDIENKLHFDLSIRVKNWIKNKLEPPKLKNNTRI